MWKNSRWSLMDHRLAVSNWYCLMSTEQHYEHPCSQWSGCSTVNWNKDLWDHPTVSCLTQVLGHQQPLCQSKSPQHSSWSDGSEYRQRRPCQSVRRVRYRKAYSNEYLKNRIDLEKIDTGMNDTRRRSPPIHSKPGISPAVPAIVTPVVAPLEKNWTRWFPVSVIYRLPPLSSRTLFGPDSIAAVNPADPDAWPATVTLVHALMDSFWTRLFPLSQI